MPEPRLDLITRVREQIASGTYSTEEKLKVVADRLLSELRASDPTSEPSRSAMERRSSS